MTADLPADLIARATSAAASLEDSGIGHHAAVVRELAATIQALAAENTRLVEEQADATRRARQAFGDLSHAIAQVGAFIWCRDQATALRDALDDLPPTVRDLGGPAPDGGEEA